MGKKCTFLWDLNHPSRVPLSQNLDLQAVLTQGNLVISCSSAFYPPTFCLVGMLFLLLFLGCFFFSKQENKSLSLDLLPASNPTPICPRVLWARQRSWHWHSLSCSEPQALPWPGSRGSEGGNALECIPAGSMLIQPTGHLVSSPCYAHSLGWEVETFCRIQHFPPTFLQTRMHGESRDHWLVCDIMLLPTYRNRCTEH